MNKLAFFDVEIDLDLYQVTNDGIDVGLGGRALDLLIYLINHRNRIVPKEEIREEVWRGAALSPAAIPTTVLELRRKLNDDAKNPRIILSKRGRGYKFAPVVTLNRHLRRAQKEGFDRLPFVAREFELECLEQAARTVRRFKSGRTVLIGGVAGIGKTRLLDEFVSRLPPDVPAVVSRCSLIEGAPPFWPFTQIVRTAMAQGVSNSPEFPEHVQRLSAVHPELATPSVERLSDSPPIDRFSLFGLWLSAIKSLSKDSPIVVAFEDIHLADRDSLDLLACFAEEIDDSNILLVATHRPPTFSDERRDRMGELRTAPNSQSILLNPLSSNEIRELLIAHGEQSEELLVELEDTTQGIPFYITQVLRHGDGSSISGNRSQLSPHLPFDGQAVISRQLSDLREDTHSALRVAALIGERFSASLLATAVGFSTEGVVAALAPAVHAHLVVDRTAEFEFSHRLLRDALANSIDSAERRRLHLSIANALIDLDDAHVRPARISDQLYQAAPLSDPNEIIRFAKLAASEALSRFAFAEASHYLQRALNAEECREKGDTHSRCSLMIELASACLYAGDKTRYRSLLIRASALARSADLPDLFAETALRLAPDYLEIEIGVNDLEHISLLEEALAILPDDRPIERSMLMARLSQALQWNHTPARVATLAEAALELAESSRSAKALSTALTARAESLHGPANSGERLRVLERLAEVALVSTDHATRLLTHARALTAHFELGNIPAVERENEVLRTLAAEADLPEYRWYPSAHDAALAMLHGDVPQARRHASVVRDLGGDTPSYNCLQTVAAHEALIAFETDCLPAAIPAIESLAREQRWAYYWRTVHVFALTESRQFGRARTICGDFSERDFEIMASEPGGGLSLALLTEALVAVKDHKALSHLYGLLRDVADRSATIGYGIGYFGSLSRYAGLAAVSLGKTQEGIDLLEECVEIEISRGAISWRAYADIDLAEARLSAGESPASIVSSLSDSRRALQSTELSRAKRKLNDLLSRLQIDAC